MPIEICEKNRFSEKVQRANIIDMEILQRWVRWFHFRGIEAIIAPANLNGTQVAVYREGLIDTDAE